MPRPTERVKQSFSTADVEREGRRMNSLLFGPAVFVLSDTRCTVRLPLFWFVAHGSGTGVPRSTSPRCRERTCSFRGMVEYMRYSELVVWRRVALSVSWLEVGTDPNTLDSRVTHLL